MVKELPQNKSGFRPANWPLEKRRLLVKLGVAIIMLVIVSFWFYSLQSSLMRESKPTQQPLLDITQIKADLNDGIQDVKRNSQLLKKIATTTSSTDPAIEILRLENQRQLEKLRQKLEQLPNQQVAK